MLNVDVHVDGRLPPSLAFAHVLLRERLAGFDVIGREHWLLPKHTEVDPASMERVRNRAIAGLGAGPATQHVHGDLVRTVCLDYHVVQQGDQIIHSSIVQESRPPLLLPLLAHD